MAETKKQNNQPQNRGQQAKIYIGPTKFGALHVVEGTIFKGGKMPAHLEELAKKNKEFAQLVVPVAELGSAKAELGKKDSPLSKCYKTFTGKEAQ